MKRKLVNDVVNKVWHLNSLQPKDQWTDWPNAFLLSIACSFDVSEWVCQEYWFLLIMAYLVWFKKRQSTQGILLLTPHLCVWWIKWIIVIWWCQCQIRITTASAYRIDWRLRIVHQPTIYRPRLDYRTRLSNSEAVLLKCGEYCNITAFSSQLLRDISHSSLAFPCRWATRTAAIEWGASLKLREIDRHTGLLFGVLPPSLLLSTV